jgi:hypothetical protein
MCCDGLPTSVIIGVTQIPRKGRGRTFRRRFAIERALAALGILLRSGRCDRARGAALR